MSTDSARPVRVARSSLRAEPHAVRVPATRPAVPPAPPPIPQADAGPVDRRENTAATRRAVRLSVLYAAGIAVVYAALVLLARIGPAAGSSGLATVLTLFGVLAVALVVVGIVYALGSVPRAVELADSSTVIIGRFGRRYLFPAREQLHPTVLQRIPAGLLTPVALESVEIAGGSTRRSFLLEEHLLEVRSGNVETRSPRAI